ncbi:MAG: histidine kinase dimerization/phospho-acceptor domain-containing protein [Pararhodobacter sp.]
MKRDRQNQRRWSLSRKLNLRVLGLVLGAWALTIGLALFELDADMNELFDGELQALVETTVLALDAQPSAAIPRTLGIRTGRDERVLRILDPAARPPAMPWPALVGDGYHDVPGWRVLRREAEGAIIEAAHSLAWRREEMIEAAVAMGLAVLPLLALLLWALSATTRALTRPVADLSEQVASRSPDDLSPVPEAGLPDELRPLASAFSTYLARIATLREGERDFAANAAHELRTPLAEARAYLQLSADPDARAAVARLDALGRRVERLLQIARLQGEIGLGRGPADLVRIVSLVLHELRPRSPRPIRFDDGDRESAMVAADPDALAIILRNLIENAAEHGTGPVRIHLLSGATLTITNPAAPGTRLSEHRGQPGKGSLGSGLGLSIVDRLAEDMGIDVAYRVEGQKVTVTLHFDEAGDPPDDPKDKSSGRRVSFRRKGKSGAAGQD